jgi:hypothetical protein
MFTLLIKMMVVDLKHKGLKWRISSYLTIVKKKQTNLLSFLLETVSLHAATLSFHAATLSLLAATL